MLTENKVYKIAKECGVSVEAQSNGLSVKYRGVELCKYSCEPDLESNLNWITTLGLAKRRHKFEQNNVPFIESPDVAPHEAISMLVSSYVRPVYKKFKKPPRFSAPECRTRNSKSRYIMDRDFQLDLDDMRRYVDFMLAMPKSGTGFANRLVMWHHRCRKNLPDYEAINRIDYNELERAIKQSAIGMAVYTMYNDKVVYARMVSGSAELNYWERLFILKLDDRLVLVKCASVSNIRKDKNDEIIAPVEPYYKVKKVSTLGKETVNAIAALANYNEVPAALANYNEVTNG